MGLVPGRRTLGAHLALGHTCVSPFSQVGDAGAAKLAACLHRNSSLVELALGPSITDLGGVALAQALDGTSGSSLSRLNLGGEVRGEVSIINQLTGRTLRTFGESLSGNSSLTDLRLSRNKGVGGAQAPTLFVILFTLFAIPVQPIPPFLTTAYHLRLLTSHCSPPTARRPPHATHRRLHTAHRTLLTLQTIYCFRW